VASPCPHQGGFGADEYAIAVGVEMFTVVAPADAGDR
jgi:hypothetical protein